MKMPVTIDPLGRSLASWKANRKVTINSTDALAVSLGAYDHRTDRRQ